MNRVLPALAALALLAAACSTDTIGEPAPSTAPTGPPDLAALVARPSTTLAGVHVDRDGATYDVTALWSVQGKDRDDPLLVTGRSDDGFVTATYRRARTDATRLLRDEPTGAERYDTCTPAAGGTTVCTRDTTAFWTSDTGRSWQQAPLPGLDGLLVDPVPSLSSGTYAALGGGDGATLFPFERVARSTDHGSTWSTADLPTFDGERAYSTGAVVLGDGRLLAALTNFSDDGAGRPADRHHGLWVSEGSDWTRFVPFEPRFVPALPSVPTYGPITSIDATGAPDPLVLVQAYDGSESRVYQSADGDVFREVTLR